MSGIEAVEIEVEMDNLFMLTVLIVSILVLKIQFDKQMRKYSKELQLTVFKGTSMLEKGVDPEEY